MDFKNAEELLVLCQSEKMQISEVMRRREIEVGESSGEEADGKMERAWEIMKDSASDPVHTPGRSMGGLIGGEAKMLIDHQNAGKGICGSILGKAIAYAMAILETNASMGLIVAAPTAGSAGIVPGLLIALQEEYNFSDKQVIQALFNAGAGIPQLIPLDEMMASMYSVGKKLPAELRETALGGCAITPSACASCGTRF